MPYIHLPAQSGNDEVLKRMARNNTLAEYKEIFDKLRARIPNIAITTDLIVGFPGETEEDFLELKQFVADTRFERLGVFTYSHEEGTYASKKFEDDVPGQVKQVPALL